MSLNLGRVKNDPYFVLGVSRDMKLPEVKKEYFKLAKKYHPDLNPDDEYAKKMFMAVQAAYRQVEDDLDPNIKSKRQDSFNTYESTAEGGAKTF